MSDGYKTHKHGINIDPISADPSNPVVGDIQFSDGTVRAKGIWEYKDGAWAAVGGSGGGGLDSFYTEDFEGQVGASSFTKGNNATFDNGGTVNGTLSDDTTTELSGDQSLKYVMGSSSTNDWIKSPNIAIDNKQSGNTVGLTFYYTYNGTDGDIKVVAWDDTGNVVMNLATDTLTAATNPKRFSVEFPIPGDSTSINWGLQVVTGNNTKILLIDDVEISTNPFVSKDVLFEDTVRLHTGNGHGSTNTKIRRFTNLAFESSGYTFATIASSQTAPSGLFSVTDSAASGTEITILKDGVYSMSYTDSKGSAAVGFGLSLNSSQLTTAINAITEADKLITTVSSAGNFEEAVAWSGILSKDDIIRVHTDGNPDATSGANSALVTFSGTAKTDHIIAYNSRNAENSMVRLHTGNGHGSSSNKIRRFTTAVVNTGNAITWNGDSSTLGSVFTINEDGVYFISTSDGYSGGTARVGLSLNSTQLTTNISSITTADRLAQAVAVSSVENTVSWSGKLSKDDVIRSHTAGDSNATALATFTITKIGVGDLLGVPKPRTCYIKDVKSSGTNGGTFTLGAWRTRDLNTLTGDTEFISLSSNQFTLSEGKYEIEASAQAHKVASHKTKLRNITDSTDDILGRSSFTGSTTEGESVSNLKDTITITTSKTFEIQHRSTVTNSSNGFGVGNASIGVNEIYCQVKITKVA